LILAQNQAFGETGFDPFLPTLKINSSASYSLQLYKHIFSSHIETLPKLNHCLLQDYPASTKDNVGQSSSKEKKQKQQETSPH
jgi:hypothetical protein